MRGLYYCDWFEQYTSELVLAVAAESHHTVSLIVREQAPEFAGQGRPADEYEIRRRVRTGISSLHILRGRHRSLNSILQIRKILRDTRPNYFHLQQTADPRFLWVAWRLPTVLTLHEPSAREGVHRSRERRQLAGAAAHWAYRRLAKVIVVHTQTCFESLSSAERRKARVIPHGVRVSVVEPSPDSKTILFFGRADGYKGIDTLLASMKTVWKTEPQARLQILASRGDGCQYESSDCRVSSTWDGFSDKELDTALLHARAICLPYTTVSGSGVGAQAYGSGKPIVASNLQGLRELVSRQELLIEPGNSDDLARAILLILSHDYGVQPIDPGRTWANVARAHISAYSALVDESQEAGTAR